MKLYNRTKVPDCLLARLLRLAGRKVKARTAGVVVKVTQGRRDGKRGGFASSGNWVSRGRLTSCRTAGESRQRIKTDRGWIALTLGKLYPGRLSANRSTVVGFYELAAHEWAHIRDYQTHGLCRRAWSGKAGAVRRQNWCDRPEEARADAWAQLAVEALDEPAVQAVIEELMEWTRHLAYIRSK